MQTRHQTDMNNKRGREEHEEIGHDAKRIAVDQHPIASHVAVAPDQSKQGEGPNPPALLHFAALSAQQSYQGSPPPGAYQAAQAAQAQQLSENPSPVIPYQQVQPAIKLNPAQSQFHTDMTQLTGTVANSKKRRKAPASSSRKLSAWQAYAHAHAQGINISVSMHAKQLSDQWKALPPEEKEKYANLAVELQAQRGPIVRKQKRVQTGKIYQKLKDAIDKIVHQHHTQQQTIRAHNISQQQQLQLATAGTTAASAAAATAAAMANQRVEPSDLHIAVLVFHGNSQHAEMMTYGTPSLASFYNDPHIHDIARAHASGWSFANTAPILPPLMQPPPGMPAYLPQDPNQHPHGPPPGMHMMQMPMGMAGVPIATMQQTGATQTPGEQTPGQPTDAAQQQQQQAPQAQVQPPQQQQPQPPPQPQQG